MDSCLLSSCSSLYIQYWQLSASLSNQDNTTGTSHSGGKAGLFIQPQPGKNVSTVWQPAADSVRDVPTSIFLAAARGQPPRVRVHSSGHIVLDPPNTAPASADHEVTVIDAHSAASALPYQRLLLPLGQITASKGPQDASMDDDSNGQPVPAGIDASSQPPESRPERGRRRLRSKVTLVSPPPSKPWHVVLYNLNPHQQGVAVYALSASCIAPRQQLPCAAPLPGDPPCSGRGKCVRNPDDVRTTLESQYCVCDDGWGSSDCSLALTELPVTGSDWTELELEPEAWAHYYVQVSSWLAGG